MQAKNKSNLFWPHQTKGIWHFYEDSIPLLTFIEAVKSADFSLDDFEFQWIPVRVLFI